MARVLASSVLALLIGAGGPLCLVACAAAAAPAEASSAPPPCHEAPAAPPTEPASHGCSRDGGDCGSADRSVASGAPDVATPAAELTAFPVATALPAATPPICRRFGSTTRKIPTARAALFCFRNCTALWPSKC